MKSHRRVKDSKFPKEGGIVPCTEFPLRYLFEKYIDKINIYTEPKRKGKRKGKEKKLNNSSRKVNSPSCGGIEPLI